MSARYGDSATVGSATAGTSLSALRTGHRNTAKRDHSHVSFADGHDDDDDADHHETTFVSAEGKNGASEAWVVTERMTEEDEVSECILTHSY